jgi:hypothetical protein
MAGSIDHVVAEDGTVTFRFSKVLLLGSCAFEINYGCFFGRVFSLPTTDTQESMVALKIDIGQNRMYQARKINDSDNHK